MSGPSGVSTTSPRSVQAIADLVGAEVVGVPSTMVTHPDAVDDAAPGAITFLRTPKYAAKWGASKASAALLTRDLSQIAGEPGDARALLYVRDVDGAMAKVLELFTPAPLASAAGVHPSAVVDPGATVHPSAWIGPGCVVAAGARVAENARLIAQVYVGPGASIGRGTTLHPGVRVLDRCRVGDRCILHAGVCIGADGFGYRPTERGPAKIPHVGNVVIEDDVEIGANSCVDRAKFSSTIIGAGTKIDNLVQIAHNCRVGKACIICGHGAIAGSVTIGDGAILGGQVGVADNVEIGAGAVLTAHSAVTNDIPPGGAYMGVPATPIREMRRNYAAFRNLAKTLSEIKKRLGQSDGPSVAL